MHFFFNELAYFDSFILITYRHMSKLILLEIKKNLILRELRAPLPIWKHKELQENNGIDIKVKYFEILLPTISYKSRYPLFQKQCFRPKLKIFG